MYPYLRIKITYSNSVHYIDKTLLPAINFLFADGAVVAHKLDFHGFPFGMQMTPLLV